MQIVRVTAAIIRQGSKILATKRGYGRFKGGWEFPGGKIEPGETSEDALIREIREELDAEITVDQLFDTVEYDYPDFHLSMDCFWCTLCSGSIMLKEHADAKWLGAADIDEVDWLPADLDLVRKIKQALSEIN